MNPIVTDENVFEVLDKISYYEQLLKELCTVIQDGHILLSRAQYDLGLYRCLFFYKLYQNFISNIMI